MKNLMENKIICKYCQWCVRRNYTLLGYKLRKGRAYWCMSHGKCTDPYGTCKKAEVKRHEID